jgi:hypothetical protein
MTLETQKREDTIILYHLIPLRCINQGEVIEALLESLLAHISTSLTSRPSLNTYGFETFVNLLLRTPIDDQVSILSSSLILLLVSEG